MQELQLTNGLDFARKIYDDPYEMWSKYYETHKTVIAAIEQIEQKEFEHYLTMAQNVGYAMEDDSTGEYNVTAEGYRKYKANLQILQVRLKSIIEDLFGYHMDLHSQRNGPVVFDYTQSYLMYEFMTEKDIIDHFTISNSDLKKLVDNFPLLLNFIRYHNYVIVNKMCMIANDKGSNNYAYIEVVDDKVGVHKWLVYKH